MNVRAEDPLPVAVGVDGSGDALRATRWAAREAVRWQVPLVVVHAIDLPDLYTSAPPSDVFMAALRKDAADVLRHATDIAKEDADIEVVTQLERGSATAALHAVSRTARMLVLGSSGRGRVLAAATLGSIPVKLAAHADCPVVVVRGENADKRSESDPVVVGLDGGPLSGPALALAFAEADIRRAPLLAAHAWSEGEVRDVFDEARVYFDWEVLADVAERTLTECLSGWAEKFPGVTVERVVVRDKPRDALLDLSERAQLVVVGSRGRGGFSGLLLGSTSQALIHHAACPVMIARSAANGTSR